MRDSPRAAAIYDLVMLPFEVFFIKGWRRLLWSMVRGPRVLELGVGTGANIPHYPQGFQVTAIDLSASMLERARRRARKTRHAVTLIRDDAQDLQHPSAFDTVVATFLLCSVSDPSQVLAKALEALTPGGQLLLLEHGRSAGGLGRLMDALAAPLYRISGDHIARDAAQLAEDSGYTEVTQHYLVLDVVKIVSARKPPE